MKLIPIFILTSYHLYTTDLKSKGWEQGNNIPRFLIFFISM